MLLHDLCFLLLSVPPCCLDLSQGHLGLMRNRRTPKPGSGSFPPPSLIHRDSIQGPGIALSTHLIHADSTKSPSPSLWPLLLVPRSGTPEASDQPPEEIIQSPQRHSVDSLRTWAAAFPPSTWNFKCMQFNITILSVILTGDI